MGNETAGQTTSAFKLKFSIRCQFVAQSVIEAGEFIVWTQDLGLLAVLLDKSLDAAIDQ
jgi:hypothetical protein